MNHYIQPLNPCDLRWWKFSGNGKIDACETRLVRF